MLPEHMEYKTVHFRQSEILKDHRPRVIKFSFSKSFGKWAIEVGWHIHFKFRQQFNKINNTNPEGLKSIPRASKSCVEFSMNNIFFLFARARARSPVGIFGAGVSWKPKPFFVKDALKTYSSRYLAKAWTKIFVAVHESQMNAPFSSWDPMSSSDTSKFFPAQGNIRKPFPRSKMWTFVNFFFFDWNTEYNYHPAAYGRRRISTTSLARRESPSRGICFHIILQLYLEKDDEKAGHRCGQNL